MKRLLILLLILFPSYVSAQAVRADRFVLNSGPCTLRSGSGSPEGVITGRVCDTYWRTDTGTIYTKTFGSGNTGWTGAGVTGSGTTGFIPKWTGPTSIGDTEILVSAKSVLPNLGYDINLGSLSKKYLTLHAAELWVETLVAQNTLATIGGRVLVAPTNTLIADINPSTTSLTFKYNNFVNGDRIYFEAGGAVEFMAVTSSPSPVTGGYLYTVVRDYDGSGANTWSAGDAAVNTGSTGNGFIDIYSVRGIKAGTEVGPAIVGNVRNTSTYNDWSPRWAIGNLNGLYGYSSNVYGAAFGVPTGSWIKIDPTNGVRIGYNTTTNIQLDSAGNASFTGAVTAASGSIGSWTIVSGLLAFDTGTNATSAGMYPGDSPFYAGATVANRVTAPFRVTPAVALTATNATITGNITATSGNVTGALGAGSITTTMLAAGAVTAAKITAGTITATEIASSTITAAKLNVSSLSAITADMGSITAGQIVVGGSNRLWMNDSSDGQLVIGGSTKGSAPFHVTAAGKMYASGAELSGSLLVIDGFVAYTTSILFPNVAGAADRYVCIHASGQIFSATSC